MKIWVVVAVLSLAASACGGDSITASSCAELADETVELIQRLIDDVDAEFGDLTVREFIATGEELPSVQRYEADAETIDALAVELGCSQNEIRGTVESRISEFTTSSDLGRFLIDSIRSGGL